MAQKPEIQYVGQFYVHGSEAKVLAQKNEQKKARTELPLHRFERVRKVHVDLLAVASLAMALVLMVSIVTGTLALQASWQELETAQQYVYELEKANRVLQTQYRAGYDLEEVRSAALALGMIPVEEAEVMPLHVTIPVQEAEPTVLDELIWFLTGLFA